MNQSNTSKRKRLQGTVLKNAMDKTVVVRVERQFRHPRVFRIVRQYKKYYAHDNQNTCQIGDVVLITETRPLSKLKRWRVEKILTKAAAQLPQSEPGDNQ
jgi:small subunit ribosomal protein S17